MILVCGASVAQGNALVSRCEKGTLLCREWFLSLVDWASGPWKVNQKQKSQVLLLTFGASDINTKPEPMCAAHGSNRSFWIYVSCKSLMTAFSWRSLCEMISEVFRLPLFFLQKELVKYHFHSSSSSSVFSETRLGP